MKLALLNCMMVSFIGMVMQSSIVRQTRSSYDFRQDVAEKPPYL